MNKFHQSKIYKLTDNTNDNVYIGSTIQTLQQRLQGHKSSAKCSKEGYGCASKSIIDNGDYKIELLEEFSCETKKELLIKEQEYINQYPSCINKVNSHTDKKQKYQQNKDIILSKKRVYDSVYHKCECGGGYCMSHRARHQSSKRCLDYFAKKNKETNKISLLYNIMSDPMNIVNLIRKFCKERNIPIDDKQLDIINKETQESNPNLIYSDDEYETESNVSSEADETDDDTVEETITICRMADGHYKLM